MQNITKKFIIIFGAIVFSFVLTNSAQATYVTNYAYSTDPIIYQHDSSGSYTGDKSYSQYSYYQSGSGNSPYYSYNPYYANQVNQVNQGYPQPQPQYAYQQSGYNTNPMIPTYPPVQSGYYQQSIYSTSTNNVVADNTTAKPNVVNNYYYQTAPATTAKTNTTSTSKTTSDTSVNSESVNSGSNNGLGASAYDNGITALSLHGSGGFMPSSIWQWMLVIVLILIIIIISRILMRKPSIEEQEAHIAHAH